LPEETSAHNWLPLNGKVSIAVTAGASTPDNIVGEVIEKLTAFATK
jgi:4-hydroxy-3-methylbut-2-enyl diphosphate reductase IspH